MKLLEEKTPVFDLIIRSIIDQYNKKEGIMRGVLVSQYGIGDHFINQMEKIITEFSNINTLVVSRTSTNNEYWLDFIAKRYGVSNIYIPSDPTNELTDDVAQAAGNIGSALEYLHKVQQAVDTMGYTVNGKTTSMSRMPDVNGDPQALNTPNNFSVFELATKEKYPKNSFYPSTEFFTNRQVPLFSTEAFLCTGVLCCKRVNSDGITYMPMHLLTPAEVLYEVYQYTQSKGSICYAFFCTQVRSQGQDALNPVGSNVFNPFTPSTISSDIANIKKWIGDFSNRITTDTTTVVATGCIDEFTSYVANALPKVDSNVLQEVIKAQGRVIQRVEMPMLYPVQLTKVGSTWSLDFTNYHKFYNIFQDGGFIPYEDTNGFTTEGLLQYFDVFITGSNNNIYALSCPMMLDKASIGTEHFNAPFTRFSYYNLDGVSTGVATPFSSRGLNAPFVSKNPYVPNATGQDNFIYNGITPQASLFLANQLASIGVGNLIDKIAFSSSLNPVQKDVKLLIIQDYVQCYIENILPLVDQAMLDKISDSGGLSYEFDIESFGVYDSTNPAQSRIGIDFNNDPKALGLCLLANTWQKKLSPTPSVRTILQIRPAVDISAGAQPPLRATCDQYLSTQFENWDEPLFQMFVDVLDRIEYSTNSIDTFHFNQMNDYMSGLLDYTLYPATIGGKSLTDCDAYDFYHALMSPSIVQNGAGQPFAQVSDYAKNYIAKNGTIALLSVDQSATKSFPNPDKGNTSYAKYLPLSLGAIVQAQASAVNIFSRAEFELLYGTRENQTFPRTDSNAFKFESEQFSELVLCQTPDTKQATQFDIFKQFAVRQSDKSIYPLLANIKEFKALNYLTSNTSVQLAEDICKLFFSSSLLANSLPSAYGGFYNNWWIKTNDPNGNITIATQVDKGYSAVNLDMAMVAFGNTLSKLVLAMLKGYRAFAQDNKNYRIKTLVDQALYISSLRTAQSIISSYTSFVAQVVSVLDIQLIPFEKLALLPTVNYTLNNDSLMCSSAFRSLPMDIQQNVVGQSFYYLYQPYRVGTLGNFLFDKTLPFVVQVNQNTFKLTMYGTTFNITNNTAVQYAMVLKALNSPDKYITGQNNETWAQMQTDAKYANVRTFFNNAPNTIQTAYTAFLPTIQASADAVKQRFVDSVKFETDTTYAPASTYFQVSLPSTVAALYAYVDVNLSTYIQPIATTNGGALSKLKFIPLMPSMKTFVQHPKHSNYAPYRTELTPLIGMTLPNYSDVYPFIGKAGAVTQSDIGQNGKLYNDVLKQRILCRLAVLRGDTSFKGVVENFYNIFGVSIVKTSRPKVLKIATTKEARDVLTFFKNNAELPLDAGTDLEIEIIS